MPNRVGIFEPTHSTQDPPGTQLFDPPEEDEAALGAAARRLKRDKKRPEIILRPQPSDSGLDPLNFSKWRKEIMFLIFFVGSICTGVIGPILVPAFGTVAQDLGVTVPRVAQLNGILVMFEGIASMVIVVTSTLYGRRSAYVGCTLLSFVGCIWGALSPTYNQLYGARILMGAGMASYAVLMGSTITDIYFTHEHGVRIALWQVSYCASVNLAPIISGVIATNHGWRSCFYVLGAFEALTLIGVLLFCPETMYHRPASASDPLEHDKYTTEHIERSEEKGTAPGTSTSSLEAQKPADVADTLTFAASLKLVHRFEKKESIWIIIARPFAVFFAPHILYATLAYTILFSWYVGTGATYGQMYSGMYYQESVNAVGLIAGIAPLIGCVAACLIAGPLTDYSARFLAVRNHGIFEPEFRLAPLVPAFVLTAIGGFGWAFTVDPKINLLVSTAFGGISICGITIGICAVIGYSNASYPKRGGDTFAVMMLVSRAVIFGLTYIFNDWLALYGVKNFLGIMTGVTLGFYLAGIPIYCYGKRLRSWTAESKALGWAT